MSIFEALNVLTSSRTKLQIPFDLKQVLSLTALTLKEKNWLRDCDLISVIHKIIGSNIIFEDSLSPICICGIEVETNLHYHYKICSSWYFETKFLFYYWYPSLWWYLSRWLFKYNCPKNECQLYNINKKNLMILYLSF